jgi:hypothetical protein
MFDLLAQPHNSRPYVPIGMIMVLKIKLKGRNFDPTEVVEAKSQVVLNGFTEHDFHDAVKTWQKP